MHVTAIFALVITLWAPPAHSGASPKLLDVEVTQAYDSKDACEAAARIVNTNSPQKPKPAKCKMIEYDHR